MKTILYNPIFINPQAYYVFPRLTRYLQPDNESTAEPANYIGTIEVKVIAYGDTTLKRTYTNTDSIDLSEFKNTWIRISLFTKVGSCVLGEWKIGNMESDLPYIDPEVLASLKAVVIVGNKTNNDSDRAIVKNLVDPDNPFVISNAAFKLNSGFGKYGMDFLEWKANSGMNFTSTKLTSTKPNLPGGWLTFRNVSGLISETKVKVSGAPKEFVFIGNNNGADDKFSVTINNGVYTIPEFTLSSASGFYINNNSGDWSNLVIEQIPSFEGAFVTDGIDDLIKSTKSATEMLDGSNEVTVVSMIHQIKTNDDTTRNNWFFTPVSYLENRVVKDKIGKTGIYGYTSTNVTNAQISDITPILGDKNDYTLYSKIEDGDRDYFTVEGFQNQGTWYVSSIAWYWTIIANKVLTTDQINQVIAYFNLDRTLKPDILCNTIKQGITNENHAEFGDKLIDYSGNGRDIQLNNIAWDGDSGIGKYNYPNWKVNVTRGNKYGRIVYYDSINGTYSADFKGVTELYKSYGLSVEIRVNRANTVDFHSIKEDGIYTVATPDDTTSIDIRFGGENVYNASCDITITQIPSHAGALCLDGVNDFGKVTGMPVYKDYTFIIDYERISYASSERWVAGVVSKSHVANQGAFILMTANTTVEPGKQAYSFGGVTSFNRDGFTRALVYQSKYKCGDVDLTVGEGVDSNTLWLGTFRDNDQRFFNGAIYSLMSFPYSMSEFLIERQLKKHKLGTLYPDMVEFRPVIKKDDRIKSIKYYIDGKTANIGQYYPIGTGLGIAVETVQPYMVKSLKVNGVNTIPNVDYKGFNTRLDSKSPQKITMDIQVDTNLIQWNPIITSTVELTTAPTFAIRGTSTLLKPGDWIPKNSEIWVIVTMNNLIDELRKFSFNGTFINIPSSSYNPDTGKYGFPFVIDNESTQNINLTIDEYIRFEDIVQPYPVLLRFNDENGNEVSWGGKFRVGSTITRIGSAADSNLLPNIYNIFGLLLNDNQVTSSKVIVEKTMVFKAKSAYIFDNNEPKCILSPRLLRIPNSSYKILGHIPDISGHGNHGKINNSAYAGMSGVNGYPVVFGANKTWANESNGYVTSITSNTIHITNVLNAGLALLYSYVKYNGNLQNIKEIPPFKIEIKGLEGRSKFIYKYLATSDATKETNLYLGNGTHELPKSFLPTEALINNAVVGFSISPIEEGVTNFLSDITIKVLPKYEGAYCLDGVDDFVTIPTTVGGKQVLMKVNWDSSNSALLYDQRGYNNEFAIYNGSADSDGNPIPAYQGRNNGQTYIDGILNSNIKASELRAITHNITITNELSAGVNKFSPVIGSNRVHNAYFTNMALYDFMLFDNISTDDKIKQLNEYVGIEGNTEWRKTK